MNVLWCKASLQARHTAVGMLCLIVLAAALVNLAPSIERYVLTGRTTCTLKLLTNVPCLGCRGTRAGFAFAKGHIGQALAFNPLAAALGLSVTSWSLVVALSGWAPSVRMNGPWQNLAWTLFGFSLAGNWIYVIAAGG